MRVLFAPDKFKGSLTARQAADAMQRGWQRGGCPGETFTHPVADGGDGTLEVIGPATGAQSRRTPVRDARGRVRETTWWWDAAARTAWIGSSAVAGLADLAADERHPLTATTAGLGELLLATAEAGAARVFLALGGSATNDAGCGMAAAAGFRFLDRAGHPLDPVPACLAGLARIESPGRTFPAVTGLVDVDSPLLGPAGASRVYGPQKGATPADVATLEQTLATIAAVAGRDLGAPDPSTPGAGAAGGLGFGIMAFFGGQLRPGFDLVAEVTGLRAAVQAADLVVTGEGRLDAQTVAGKAPCGVARLARDCGKPVIALAGSVPLTKGDDRDFDVVLPITNEPMTLENALQQAGPLLEEAAARAARLVRLGQFL